jgi:hypothetical protein
VSSFSGLLVFALMIACLGGCTRQYVAKPAAARDYNALDWTIESAPQASSREQAGSAVDESDRTESDSGAVPLEEAIDESEENR